MATFPNPLTRAWLDTAIQARPTKASLKQQYVGLKYFPLRPVQDYEITWDVINSGNRIAGIYDHHGVPIPGDDYDYAQKMADIVNIMASRVIDTKTVMVLRDAGEPAVENNATLKSVRQRHLDKVAEKVANADDEVEAVIEYLCLQALQGTITWPPVDDTGAAIVNPPASWGGVSFALSMGFRANFIQNISTLSGWGGRAGGGLNWKNVAAKPIQDMEVIAELMQRTTGMSMTNAKVITSRSTLSWLAFNTDILTWVRGTFGPANNLGYIDVEALKTFIATKMGWNIELYDAIWTYPSSLGSGSGVTENQVHFLKEGKMIVIPNGALDNAAYFATAPDPGQDNTWQTGKYTWTYRAPTPPYTQEIGVGLHGFPILKTSQEIACFDVYN